MKIKPDKYHFIRSDEKAVDINPRKKMKNP